jgi:hypothetical protein
MVLNKELWCHNQPHRWTLVRARSTMVLSFVGLARTMYIRCIHGIFGREITNYTVIYGAYIRFWPTLLICNNHISTILSFAKCTPRYCTLCMCTRTVSHCCVDTMRIQHILEPA